jgi:hypothetical protein
VQCFGGGDGAGLDATALLGTSRPAAAAVAAATAAAPADWEVTVELRTGAGAGLSADGCAAQPGCCTDGAGKPGGDRSLSAVVEITCDGEGLEGPPCEDCAPAAPCEEFAAASAVAGRASAKLAASAARLSSQRGCQAVNTNVLRVLHTHVCGDMLSGLMLVSTLQVGPAVSSVHGSQSVTRLCRHVAPPWSVLSSVSA